MNLQSTSLDLSDRIVPKVNNSEFQEVLSKLELSSNAVCVTGIGFGDEGKGRIVHELAEEIRALTDEPLAAVVKVNGGANSGHTAAGLKLNLLPTGVADTTVENLILGRGVVADPHKLNWESVPLDNKGYAVTERLIIDERTMLSDLTHRLQDMGRELWLERTLGVSRGSTGRGISPAFKAETDQTQIYYDAFLGPKDRFAFQLNQNIDHCEVLLKHRYELNESEWEGAFEKLTSVETRANADSLGYFSANEFEFEKFKGEKPLTFNREALIEAYWEAGQSYRDSIRPGSEVISKALNENKFVVFEFGQAYLLGKRTGFPPNVTASHPYTPEIFSSAGIPMQPVHNVTASKAYDTKVGTHLFLTEIPSDHVLSPILQKLEFGTTTGRQRMVGWFDAVEKGHTLREGGFEEIVINKLDALTHSGDWQGQLQICTGYELANGTVTKKLPLQDEVRNKAKPVYKSLDGWSEDITAVGSFKELPEAAKEYVAALYYHTIDAAFSERDLVQESELPGVRFVGVGPDPGQLIRDIPSPRELIELHCQFSVKN